jgi:hypothetical protein
MSDVEKLKKFIKGQDWTVRYLKALVKIISTEEKIKEVRQMGIRPKAIPNHR